MSSKQKRQGFRLSAQNAVAALETLKSQEIPPAYEQLQKKRALLKSFLERIEALDNEILASIADPDEIETELESIRSFNDRLFDAIADCQPVVASPLSPAPNIPVLGGAHTARFKLPQLRIPPFEGNSLRWQEFWDSCRPRSTTVPT